MVQPLLDALDQRVLVCDGAMGTMLYAKGIFINKSFDELNLSNPDLVGQVHQEYVRAGADIIETNTFGANRIKLGKSRDDKRRHFVRDEVLACKSLRNIDVFLTHEAPRPFYPAGRRIDSGKTVINEVITAMRPRLHLFGHHHEFTDSVRQGVRSIGLDMVTRSYLLIDAESFRCERLDT